MCYAILNAHSQNKLFPFNSNFFKILSKQKKNKFSKQKQNTPNNVNKILQLISLTLTVNSADKIWLLAIECLRWLSNSNSMVLSNINLFHIDIVCTGNLHIYCWTVTLEGENNTSFVHTPLLLANKNESSRP